jgi:drug/metabolite transporter (DMT)-like permease
MKDAIERQSVNNFLFTRFSLAVIVMILIRPKVIRLLTKDLLLKGLGAGFILGVGYTLQTLGLARTGAAITGFITGLYVILTPLLSFLFFRDRLNWRIWIYVIMATVGLALLSLKGWSGGLGEVMVFFSAVFFALHIMALSKWSSGRDVYAMTITQLTMCAIISGVASAFEGYSAPPDAGVWTVIIFTAVFATAIAFMVQTWSQAHMSATKVAVILTMEVVFAAFFAVILGGERLGLRQSIGGALMVAAMFLIVLKEA